MAVVFNYIEELLRSSFNPDKINYLVLMMVDHQVHFHVIPRYEKERVFNDKEFVDEKWPTPPDILLDSCDESFLPKLLKKLRK